MIKNAKDLERFLSALNEEYLDENNPVESIFSLNNNVDAIDSLEKLEVATKFGFDISQQQLDTTISQLFRAIEGMEDTLAFYICQTYSDIWQTILTAAAHSSRFVNIVECLNSVHRLELAVRTGFKLDESSYAFLFICFYSTFCLSKFSICQICFKFLL